MKVIAGKKLLFYVIIDKWVWLAVQEKWEKQPQE